MPKLWNNPSAKGMLRELLLTTLATTISIILTFGTAAYLEHRQQEKNHQQIIIFPQKGQSALSAEIHIGLIHNDHHIPVGIQNLLHYAQILK